MIYTLVTVYFLVALVRTMLASAAARLIDSRPHLWHDLQMVPMFTNVDFALIDVVFDIALIPSSCFLVPFALFVCVT